MQAISHLAWVIVMVGHLILQVQRELHIHQLRICRNHFDLQLSCWPCFLAVATVAEALFSRWPCLLGVAITVEALFPRWPCLLGRAIAVKGVIL